MYWVYLALFVLIIFIPKIVREGFFLFSEEDFEAFSIFGLGALGFLLYLAKEKALLRLFAERLNLQKQTNLIVRDLSDSYSYIGEMNRKFDVVKDLLLDLPQMASAMFSRRDDNPYRSLLEAVRLLSKSKSVSLRLVHTGTKTTKKIVEEGKTKIFSSFDADRLLSRHETLWEEDGCVIVRSPRTAFRMNAFLLFPKTTNSLEDGEIFKVLASEGLFLYCLEQNVERHHCSTGESV